MGKKVESNRPAAEKIPVAYLIDWIRKGGGTENQLATLINNIDKTRFSSHLVNLRPHDPKYKLGVECPILCLNFTKLFSIRAFVALLRFIRFLRKNRVKILQLYFIDSNIFGVIAGRLAGVKNIIVNRRDMGLWHSKQSRILANRVNRFAPYCVANASAVKEVVSRTEPFEEAQIRVIPNGINYRRAENPSLTPQDFTIRDSVPVVGIVANLKPIKRIDMFLRVAARLREKTAHFIILGLGPLKEKLMAQAKSLQITSRVTFHHTDDRVFEVLALFDVGVLTSETEGLSNVLIEYGLAGVPAVAFDTGGNGEVIINGRTGFIIPADDETLMAEKIDYLLSNPQIRDEMSEAARKLTREKFSVKTMVSKIENLYMEILQNG